MIDLIFLQEKCHTLERSLESDARAAQKVDIILHNKRRRREKRDVDYA